MLDLKKVKMPSSIEVDGIFYPIKTDYQYWLRFVSMMKEKHNLSDFNFMYQSTTEPKTETKTEIKKFLFFKKIIHKKYLIEKVSIKYPQDRQKGLDALIQFAFPKSELPRSMGESSKEILLDYDIDADLIYSAFYEVYKIDLLDEKLHLHWYKFKALLSGLHDTKLNEIMGYRSFVPRGKQDEYQKQMLKAKKAWRIDTPLSEEEKEADDAFEKAIAKK